MNATTAQLYSALCVGTISVVLSRSIKTLCTKYGQAFELDEVVLKSAIALVLSVVATATAFFLGATLPWWGWALFVPVGTVAGAAVLTAAHFTVHVVVNAAVIIWNLSRGLVTSLFASKPQVVAA
jgi:hypothetical protein